MRRAIVALVSTAAGTVLLVGAKTGLGHTAGPAAAPAANESKQPTPSAGPAKTSAPARSAPAATSKAPAGNGLRNGTFKGSSIDTDYGKVQVSIVIAGGKLTDVKTLECPSEEARSVQICNTAVPRLRQEALTAQSATINSVSGASYTSDGYRRSLQSAIDQARGA